jgi:hypothetical protein
VHAVQLLCCGVKLPNLKLKTRNKQLLDSLPVDIVLPEYFFLTLSLIIDVVLQFVQQLKLVYTKNIGFVEHDCIFEHCRKVEAKRLGKGIIFHKNGSTYIFRATP